MGDSYLHFLRFNCLFGLITITEEDLKIKVGEDWIKQPDYLKLLGVEIQENQKWNIQTEGCLKLQTI